MRLSRPPTALFPTTGNLVMGAFRVLKELRLRIPDDVSLTFGNYPWTSLEEPAIDVTKQPVDAVGKAALVLREIRLPNSPVEQLRFSGWLIKRGSCAGPRA